MKKYGDIILRYFILVLIAIIGFDIFYFIFLPLTKYTVFYLLRILFEPVLLGNSIFLGFDIIEIIGACVGGSAYFFLLILNLSTPDIKIDRRIYMILIAFGSFFMVNILRIFFLSLMYINNSPLFDITHKIFWYLGSTILVVAIWMIEVKLFKVKKIPFYTDLKNLYKNSSLNK